MFVGVVLAVKTRPRRLARRRCWWSGLRHGRDLTVVCLVLFGCGQCLAAGLTSGLLRQCSRHSRSSTILRYSILSSHGLNIY